MIAPADPPGPHEDPPPPFSFETPDPLEGVCHVVPRALSDLAANAGRIFGIDPEAVLLAGLGHLAAAIGRKLLLSDGVNVFPPSFSFVAASHDGLGADWIGLLGEGWIAEALCFQRTFTPAVRRMLESEDELGATPEPDPVISSLPPLRLPILGKPEILDRLQNLKMIVDSCHPNEVLEALKHSLDQNLTLTGFKMDFFGKLPRMALQKQSQLFEMLGMAWKRIPIPCGNDEPSRECSIQLICETPAQPLAEFLFGPKSQYIACPPPVVFFHHDCQPRRFPLLQDKATVTWRKLVIEVVHQRLSPSPPAPLTLSDSEIEIAEDFYTEFRAALSRLPRWMIPHVSWMPDLALRMFSIVKVKSELDHVTHSNRTSAAKQPSEPSIVAAIRLTRWIAQKHHAALLSLKHLFDQGRAERLALLAGITDSTDRSQITSQILTRIRSKGAMTRRELSRSFHSLPARVRDAAIQQLLVSGLVSAGSDGRLRASESACEGELAARQRVSRI